MEQNKNYETKGNLIGVDFSSEGVEDSTAITPVAGVGSPATLSATQLLSLNRQRAIINKNMSDVEKSLNSLTNVDRLKESLQGLKAEDIKKLSDEEITNLYKDKDGHEIEVEIKGIAEDRAAQFRRDLLELILTQSEASEEMEKAVTKINEEIVANQEEFDKAISEYGNMTGYLEATMLESIKKAKEQGNDDAVKRFVKLHTYFTYSFTQEHVIEMYKKLQKPNFFADYTNEDKQLNVYERYLRVTKRLNLSSDITKFDNIESKFPFAEEFKSYPNIFLFAIIRYYAYTKPSETYDGIYLSQLISNVQEYISDSMDASRKEVFEKGVKDLISTIVY